ncbi:nitroimidazol reductase NimA-like FMN-containing flavoprotein (pyridoxamine 5'-phosphate oxidase superfamily) [Parabacteroides sp. PF5-5]|uniref:pyridoxamine 5'-phosphate oxidase family protein n=1 Tax=unclassified Parabacteroides TaxID=2649774 RepID=UPI002474A8E6|nr:MULTISPECIES: pyridoxamine 5'-phosphate oxidase family protein [unclassified Parabacteroides]MDH6305716.1 nitroimidazol reductase NimA-like FMN-containing flavoprotein (pyridoxamine 5'-phosphate oxidase superfamily) [Parabacteroides sp. PH5-39]MDH6316788.1 nitroimidazol reductase NimA-like FMN-containing flavoprotein (pyridoxamine 5'-phosphate oxidase superfamily) [Parabacteroides sp. PF5-13]MDH6320429.1 nitroimidazol reductase NimA-like FMN-containing flavoprotein (pyridoxamine 5'-phosphate 
MKKLIHSDPEIIESVIRACSVCFVGMADTDGTPYVLPMSFGYRDGVVYLHSSQEGRSISILERNPRVCITFCTDPQLTFQHPEVACSYSVRSRSVIGWGIVTYEEDPEKKRDALKVLMRQYADQNFHYNDPAVRNVKIWVVPLTEMTCKEFGVQSGR